MNQIFVWAPKIMRKVAMTSSTHLVLDRVSYMPWEVGSSEKKNDHLRRTSLGYYPRAPTPWQPLQDWQTISRNNHGLETWSFTRELRTKFTSCAESHSQLVHEWPSSQSNLVRYSLVVSFTISIAVFLKVSVIWDLEWGRGCESESLQHGLTHCSR